MVSADTVIPMVVNTKFRTAAGYCPGYVCNSDGTKVWLTNGTEKWHTGWPDNCVVYIGTIPVEVTGFKCTLVMRYKASKWDGHFIEEIPIDQPKTQIPDE